MARSKSLKLFSVAGKIKFIEAAISDDITRYFMTHAYYDFEAKAIIATNGRVLHIWNLDQNELKLFDSSKSSYVQFLKETPYIIPVNVDGQFPMWRKVLPEMKPNYILDASHNESWTTALCMKIDILLNPKYLKPLDGADGVKVTTMKRDDKGHDHAVRLDFCDARREFGDTTPMLTAVIMPMDYSAIEDIVHSTDTGSTVSTNETKVA